MIRHENIYKGASSTKKKNFSKFHTPFLIYEITVEILLIKVKKMEKNFKNMMFLQLFHLN